jgi:hypothetical protein
MLSNRFAILHTQKTFAFSISPQRQFSITKPKKDLSQPSDNEIEDEYDGYSDYDVEPYKNPETGEIGGQKGPSPTRYFKQKYDSIMINTIDMVIGKKEGE